MSESAFEQLVISRLSDLAEGHKEIKAELVAVQLRADQTHTIATQTLEQAKVTNGRVTLLENWQDTFEDETDVGAAYAAGRQSVRVQDKALIGRIIDRVEKPLMYGVAAILIGVGIRLGAWFVGGIW